MAPGRAGPLRCPLPAPMAAGERPRFRTKLELNPTNRPGARRPGDGTPGGGSVPAPLAGQIGDGPGGPVPVPKSGTGTGTGPAPWSRVLKISAEETEPRFFTNIFIFFMMPCHGQGRRLKPAETPAAFFLTGTLAAAVHTPACIANAQSSTSSFGNIAGQHLPKWNRPHFHMRCLPPPPVAVCLQLQRRIFVQIILSLNVKKNSLAR
jgi:hypothetical protein